MIVVIYREVKMCMFEPSFPALHLIFLSTVR
uniref:Uncharacterized protein n=1 Tax=Arundo donax TaxID=35708 RepID=A0A0A9FWQ6_ARUDO